jgi:tRNA(adenine34) deaminase
VPVPPDGALAPGWYLRAAAGLAGPSRIHSVEGVPLNMPTAEDERYMRAALREAAQAASEGEVPVGCVVVRDGRVVARAHNLREASSDPTAHAEIVALRRAGAGLGTWHLDGATVYVTVEPCCMCAGALVNARATRLVYGADDPKSGACASLYDVVRDARLNHQLQVERGVLAEEALALLRRFFGERRSGAPCGEA